MLLSQDLIIFDLEATSSLNRAGFQENKNIIQIGAVYLKRVENKTFEITDRFNQLIKPKDEVISPFIEVLTGITNQQVKDKNFFDYAGILFREWANKNGNIRSTQLCAWGTYFDLPLLRKLYENFEIKYPFYGAAYDVKTWAALWMMLKEIPANDLSLEKMAGIMNIKVEGKFHDALVDAEVTARIALNIFSDLSDVSLPS